MSTLNWSWSEERILEQEEIIKVQRQRLDGDPNYPGEDVEDAMIDAYIEKWAIRDE